MLLKILKIRKHQCAEMLATAKRVGEGPLGGLHVCVRGGRLCLTATDTHILYVVTGPVVPGDGEDAPKPGAMADGGEGWILKRDAAKARYDAKRGVLNLRGVGFGELEDRQFPRWIEILPDMNEKRVPAWRACEESGGVTSYVPGATVSARLLTSAAAFVGGDMTMTAREGREGTDMLYWESGERPFGKEKAELTWSAVCLMPIRPTT
jgi:hypothetical protein